MLLHLGIGDPWHARMPFSLPKEHAMLLALTGQKEINGKLSLSQLFCGVPYCTNTKPDTTSLKHKLKRMK